MISTNEYNKRMQLLKDELLRNNLDVFIISESNSIYYYTGASYAAQERPFIIIVTPQDEPVFLVPKFEEEHMQKTNIGSVIAYWEFPSPPGEGWTNKIEPLLAGKKKIGLEPGISLENYSRIAELAALSESSVKPYPLIENIILVKSAEEISMIRESAGYADLGMSLIIDNAYYGISVLEMFSMSKKTQLEVLKSGNYDPLQCEFLSATWPAPHSAKPHGVPPVNGRLKKGPLAAMSYLKVNGYAAECERTFFLSEPSKEEIKIFKTMETAREKAFSILKPGIRCSEIDKAAKEYLTEAGYGKYLLHRTGHGIGQGNHEGPWIAEGSNHILEENMVISIEPGIYIPEVGGFRHSDTVLITSDGYECLTHFPNDIESLTIKKKRPLKKIKGKIIRKAVRMS